tara:strand:- start:18607 stop:19620 length:1014 start_codon:yes stop_codon:yes gene_type:complete
MPAVIDEHIDELLKATSRSFHLTLTALPSSIRDQLGLLYLLARLADTIADSKTKDVDMLIDGLDGYRNLLTDGENIDLNNIAEIQDNPNERRLLENLGSVVNAFEEREKVDRDLMIKCLLIIIQGQRLDLVRFGALGSNLAALNTDSELDEYTYHVAGSVGEFWTSISLLHEIKEGVSDSEKFQTLGVRFGKALQMTNILRDIPADIDLGRCYIPIERLNQINLDLESLRSSESIDSFRPLYDQYLDLACDHYDAAIEYIRMIPRKHRRLRTACIMPVVIGLETIRLLRYGNILDAENRIKVDRKSIRRIAIMSSVATWIKPIENRLLDIRAKNARG